MLIIVYDGCNIVGDEVTTFYKFVDVESPGVHRFGIRRNFHDPEDVLR